MTAPAIGANRARFFFSCIVSVLTKTVTVALMEGNTLEMSTHTHTHTHTHDFLPTQRDPYKEPWVRLLSVGSCLSV